MSLIPGRPNDRQTREDCATTDRRCCQADGQVSARGKPPEGQNRSVNVQTHENLRAKVWEIANRTASQF